MKERDTYANHNVLFLLREEEIVYIFQSKCLMILFQDDSKKLFASDTGMLRS